MKIKILIVLTVVAVIQSAQAQVTDDAPKKASTSAKQLFILLL